MPTDYTLRQAQGTAYTGQYSYTQDFGLMYYNARWYDPYLNHMTQPDTIVPDPYNSQDYDRYAYARNNPLRYTDPTGHEPKNGNGACYEIGCKNANGTNVWDGNGKGGVVSIDKIKKQLEQYDIAVDPKLLDREILYIFDAVISIG